MLKTFVTVFSIILIHVGLSSIAFSCEKHEGGTSSLEEENDNES